ncbi:hypothetical protein NGRA_0743 [Nosema granulosis]|uniref:Uncharacterized protein n=1 Tax=Nosema granulosis TaxID=83296 RepID=A0A9P6KZA6_9MICR|nr:hypothetical protein NGRA_0743 [Nosema granulosis]
MENIEEELLSKLDIPFFYNNLDYINKWIDYYLSKNDIRILFLMKFKKISCDYHWLHIELAKYFTKINRKEIAVFILQKALENKVYDSSIIRNTLEQYVNINPISEVEAHQYLYPKNFKALGKIWNSYTRVLYYKEELFKTKTGYISIEEYRYLLIKKNINKRMGYNFEEEQINNSHTPAGEISEDKKRENFCKKRQFFSDSGYCLKQKRLREDLQLISNTEATFCSSNLEKIDPHRQIIAVYDFNISNCTVKDWLSKHFYKRGKIDYSKSNLKLVDLLKYIKDLTSHKASVRRGCSYKETDREYTRILELYLLKVLKFIKTNYESKDSISIGDLYVDQDLNLFSRNTNSSSKDIFETLCSFFNSFSYLIPKDSLRKLEDLINYIDRLERIFKYKENIYLAIKQRRILLEVLVGDSVFV